MRAKYNIILSEEESFARAVALRMVVMRPLSVWRYLIPFMFLFDFLKRRQEIEIFSRNFLFTKKQALDVALDIIRGEDRQSRLARVEEELRDWLQKQRIYSWGIQQGQMKEINLLIDHYSKLLKAEGKSYRLLVKDAYKTEESYHSFLRQLTSAEREVDRAIVDALGGKGELEQALSVKQAAIEEMRERWASKIF